MKKSNFTYKTLILLAAFITFSFITKEKKEANNYIKKIETSSFFDTFELIVVYPSGLTFFEKIQRRQCILSTLQYYGVGTFSIESITQCPSNPNAEVIKFGVVRRKDNVDDIEDDEVLSRPNHIKVGAYVSSLAFLTILDDCNIISASGNINCSATQGLSGNFGPQ